MGGNVIFDILERPVFLKYSLRWVFEALLLSLSCTVLEELEVCVSLVLTNLLYGGVVQKSVLHDQAAQIYLGNILSKISAPKLFRSLTE